MGSKGKTKSAASVKVKSSVRCQALSPSDAPTVGMIVCKKQALQMARDLIMLALDDEIEGDIVLTGHVSQRRITILGYKEWKRMKDRNDD